MLLHYTRCKLSCLVYIYFLEKTLFFCIFQYVKSLSGFPLRFYWVPSQVWHFGQNKSCVESSLMTLDLLIESLTLFVFIIFSNLAIAWFQSQLSINNLLPIYKATYCHCLKAIKFWNCPSNTMWLLERASRYRGL